MSAFVVSDDDAVMHHTNLLCDFLLFRVLGYLETKYYSKDCGTFY